jgi:hypothetical protein
MNWDALDFAVFGGMFAVVVFVFLLVRSKSSNSSYRFAAAVALAAAFILTWVNGAVGIIGNEENDANLMFFGVLAVGAVGSIIARGRAPAMTRAMYATAVAQALVAVIAIAGDMGTSGPVWPKDLLVMTAFFVALWVVAGRLFGKAD